MPIYCLVAQKECPYLKSDKVPCDDTPCKEDYQTFLDKQKRKYIIEEEQNEN